MFVGGGQELPRSGPDSAIGLLDKALDNIAMLPSAARMFLNVWSTGDARLDFLLKAAGGLMFALGLLLLSELPRASLYQVRPRKD